MYYLKKIFFSFFIFSFLAVLTGFAVELDTQYLENGNKFYQEYLTTRDVALLDEAYLNYYKASEIRPTASAFLGMGIIFIEKGKMNQAKHYLYKAYSADESDAITNYYLAKFYFYEGNYLRALSFYKQSYENGLAENYDVNLKLGIIYEKVGDIGLAKQHYKIAYILNPQDKYAHTRLSCLETSNVQETTLYTKPD